MHELDGVWTSGILVTFLQEVDDEALDGFGLHVWNEADGELADDFARNHRLRAFAVERALNPCNRERPDAVHVLLHVHRMKCCSVF